MFQRISCASNEDIVTIKEVLLNRAEQYKRELEPEAKNIAQLKQALEDYIKGKDTSIKMVMLREFAADLGIVLEKYQTK